MEKLFFKQKFIECDTQNRRVYMCNNNNNNECIRTMYEKLIDDSVCHRFARIIHVMYHQPSLTTQIH